MASEIIVQTIKGPTSGANANKVIIPSGQTLDASAGFVPPAGSILQVKQAFKTDAGTGATSSFADISGLFVTITPKSASSKFLIMFNIGITTYDLTAQIRLLRDTTAIGIGDASSSRTRTTAGQMNPDTDQNHQAPKMSGVYIDSPNTTSAITYRPQFKVQDGSTAYINRSGNDADNSNWSHRQTSDFTVMEIAG